MSLLQIPQAARVFAIPRTIFEQISTDFGSGEVGEIELLNSSIPPDREVGRPLSPMKLYPLVMERVHHMGLVLRESHPTSAYPTAELILLPRMPEDSSQYGMTSGVSGLKPFITLHVGVRPQEGPSWGKRLHYLEAYARTEFSRGLSFQSNRLVWPLVREILDRFYELTDKIPHSVYLNEEAEENAV